MPIPLRGMPRFLRRAPPHLRLGKWGERRAERYLRAHTNLRILGRRVRVGKHDEIDLVAREGSVLVVVEVKTRAREGARPVRAAVDRKKQYRLNRAALAYVHRLSIRPEGIRFDIVEVVGAPASGPPEIHHHPGAFGLHPGFRY